MLEIAVDSLIESLPPPHPKLHPDNALWVDEQIWGHRLWDSQSPWLIFLEFLVMAEACHRKGGLLQESGEQSFSYRPNQRMALRNILYNSEALVQISERFKDSQTAWTKWLAAMEENAQGSPTRDFSYLKSRFQSFHQFAALVLMLRSTTIEAGSNKRWSSRFVFPFGPHALYEDLSVSSGTPSREYIYFGLPGELLYQMLTRSRHADKLRPHLERAFETIDPCERLLARLQPDGADENHRRGNSYLPYRHHPSFDALAADWLALFEMQLPRFDAYPHLAALAALHLLLYHLRVAAATAGRPTPFFVCEVVAPRKTLVRELSFNSYINNNELPNRAVEAYVMSIANTAEWRQKAAEVGGFVFCREMLQNKYRWPRDADDYTGPADPEQILAELRRTAQARHRQHVANVHRSYGGGVGLVSRRGTNRFRYAPTDALLKALILANVKTRLEYSEFLALLFRRYGLVLGDIEAAQVLDPEDFDKKAFLANSERLERRLKALGMLRRLSDACAYVENPFGRRSR
jgi:hypothetical protein